MCGGYRRKLEVHKIVDRSTHKKRSDEQKILKFLKKFTALTDLRHSQKHAHFTTLICGTSLSMKVSIMMVAEILAWIRCGLAMPRIIL